MSHGQAIRVGIINRMATSPGFYGANAAVTTGAVTLGASTVLVDTGIRIKALTGNTSTVFLGNDSGVTSGSGYPLYAGQEVAFDVGWFKVASQTQGNLSGIYVLSAAGTQGVAYWGV